MLINQGGVRSVSAVNDRQILFDVKMQTAVSVIVSNAGLSADSDGKKILKAGTPIAGDLTNRDGSTFAQAVTSTTAVKGVYEVTISTAFANDEVITIEGVAYTKKATESVANKQFEGTTAAEQVTSLLKMITTADFVVTGSAAKLIFTQKVAQSNNPPSVSKTSSTGVISAVVETTQAVTGAGGSNAVGVLLHDADVTAGNQNATCLIFGFVNLNRLESATQALVTADVKAALPMIKFLKG